MTDPVGVASIVVLGSMFSIVIGGTLGGLLLYWLDGRADHGAAH